MMSGFWLYTSTNCNSKKRPPMSGRLTTCGPAAHMNAHVISFPLNTLDCALQVVAIVCFLGFASFACSCATQKTTNFQNNGPGLCSRSTLLEGLLGSAPA